MIRDVSGFVFGLAFAAWMLGLVVSALGTGRIHHTDSTSTFSFRKQPVRFTLVAMLFVVIGGMCLYLGLGAGRWRSGGSSPPDFFQPTTSPWARA